MASVHTTHPFHVKSVNEAGLIRGYASVFGVRDAQGDRVLLGAFRRSIEEAKASGTFPKLLWQHQPEAVIGTITDLKEDAHGLVMEAQLLLEVAKGREAYSLLKAGAIDGLSIGFEVVHSSIESGGMSRLLEEVRLWEISLVTFPANVAAKITAVKANDPWGLVLESLKKAAGILRPRTTVFGGCFS